MSGPAIVALFISVSFGLLALAFGVAEVNAARAIAKSRGRE